MSDPEKMSALDFVISVLKEHEKTLDSLAEKFEKALKNLSALENALNNLPARSKAKEKTATVKYGRNIQVLCKEWDEFREVCMEAEVFSFQVDGELRVKALQDNIIYEYREPVRGRLESLECGVPVNFQAHLNPSKVRRFLSKELKVPENRIIQGEIRFSP